MDENTTASGQSVLTAALERAAAAQSRADQLQDVVEGTYRLVGQATDALDRAEEGASLSRMQVQQAVYALGQVEQRLADAETAADLACVAAEAAHLQVAAIQDETGEPA